MKLQTTKHKKNKATKGRKLTQEQQFQRVWKKVLKAKQRNASLKQTVHDFACDVTQKIQLAEEQYSSALYLNTEQLIRFLTRKSLSQWERHELYDWIGENIEELSHHPFSSHLDVPALRDHFMEVLPVPDELDETSAHMFDEPVDKKETQQTETEETIDIFGEHIDINEENNSGCVDDDDPFQHFYDEMFEEQQAQEEQRKIDIQALDQVLKASSINKMFRKIASRLHPDREQDNDKKAEKNQQMSELVEARDQRDVLTLFALYEEHVGEPIDQLIGDDHNRLTTLLTHQLTVLEEEHELLIDDEPKAGMIFRRFHATKKSIVQTKIQQHLESLRTSTQQTEYFIKEVSSLKKLKPHLNERYHRYQQNGGGLLAHFLDDMPFFMED